MVELEQTFLDIFDSQGLETEATIIGQRSDHFAFCVSGIPCGGLFTGAEGIKTAEQVAIYGGTEGDQYDPCYHIASDTFDNISLTALDQMSDAAAHATAWYAFDLASIPDLRSVIQEQIQANAGRIVVDLTHCDFVDSAGLGTLLGGRRRARAAGGDLQIVVPPRLRRPFESCDLDRIFTLHPSLDDAIAALGPGSVDR